MQIIRRLIGVAISLFFASVFLFGVEAAEETPTDLSAEELLHIRSGDKGKGIFVSQPLKDAEKEIRIGVVVPLTLHPEFSRHLIRVIEEASQRINLVIPEGGKSIRVIYADDAGDSEIARELTQQMIERYNVRAIVGPSATNRVVKVANRVTIPTNIPLISSSASGDVVAELNDNDLVFQMLTTNREQAKAFAEFMREHLKVKTFAVVYARSLYGSQLKQALEKELENSSVKKVGDLSISTLVDYSTYDLSKELNDLIERKPEAVVLLMTEVQGVPIIEQMVPLLPSSAPPYLIGADALFIRSFASTIPKPILKCTFFAMPATDKNYFVRVNQFARMLNMRIDLFDTVNGFDGFLLMALSAWLADQYHIDNIVKVMRQLTAFGEPVDYRQLDDLLKRFDREKNYQFNGLSGTIHFDDNGVNLNSRFGFWFWDEHHLNLYLPEYQCKQ